MIAGQLEIQLLANVARLVTDMDKANKTVSSAMGKIDKVVGATTKILGAFGIGLSINYFGKMIQGTIDAQDNLAKLSQKVGVSVTALAGLEHAASLSGVGMAGLEKGLKGLSTQMFDASKGIAAAQENFSALGINVLDATGALKSADSVMIEVADRFKEMEDGTAKTALAVKLFGRAGLDLIPMLNEGSAAIASMVAEGQRLNPVTEESAKQAEIYNDNMERLSKTASAFGIVLVNNLLPYISELSEQFVEFTRSDKFGEMLHNIATIAEILAAILLTRLVVALGATAAGFVSSTYQSIAYQAALARMAGVSTAAAVGTTALAGTMGVLNSAMMLVGGPVGVLILIVGGLALMISKMESATESTSRLRKEMDSLSREELERGIRLQQAYVDGLEFQIQKLERSGTAYAAAKAQLIELNSELEAGQKALQELERGMQGVKDRELDKLIDDMTEGYITLAPAIKTTTQETVKFEAATIEAAEATKDLRTNAEYLAAVYGDVAVGVYNTAEAYVELMGISAQASKANIEGVADWRAAINDLPGTMVKVGETNSEVSEQAARDWAQFRDSFSDSLADMLMDGGNVFDDLGKSFERMLYKMAGDLIASGVMSFLTGQKGGFSFAGSLAGSGTTGTLVSAGLSKFAPGLAGALGIGGGAAVSTAGLTAAQAAAINLPAAGAAGGAGLAGVGSALASAVPWALAAAAVYKIFAKESTPSFNAGLLLHDVPGAKANQKFDVDPFASGLDPVGFMRDQTKEAATAVIDTFRALDKTVVDIAAKAGLTVSANAGTFRNFGLAETGLNSGSGVFLGSAGEDGKPGVSLETQLDQYTKSLIATLTGQLDGEVLNKVLSSGNAEQMIAALNDELKMTEDAAVAATDSITVFTEALIESAESLAATKALESISMNTGGGSSVSFGAAQYLGGGAQQAGTHYSNGKLVQAFNSALPMTVDYNPWANSQFEELRNLYSSDGSHANGLDYVPFDGYKATLHKGERVQTSSSAKDSDATASEIRDLKQVVQSLLTSINSNTRSASNRLDEMNSEGIYSRAI